MAMVHGICFGMISNKEPVVVGETNLNTLLGSICPELSPGEYVFCTLEGSYGDYSELAPIASFMEAEGLTLVLSKEDAMTHGLCFQSVFRVITLTVHSSLDAVGLTAAVSRQLADKGISANVVAAYYHDHIFVQSHKAQLAMEALNELRSSCGETPGDPKDC